MIFHVTTNNSWEQAVAQGYYSVESLQKEGFIHCSQASQLEGVLQRYYQGQQNLLLLHIDEAKINAPLRYDLAPSINEKFPHIYGPLNIDAVVKTEKI